MDQDAFRALLSTTSSSNPSQRSHPKSKKDSKSLALGSGRISKSTNKSNPSGSTYKPSASSSLKPRKFTSKEPDSNSKDVDRNARSGYRDRALERRQGLDGDFAEAENLLKNFQARVAAAGSQIDKDTLEQQTKYLGGDERHTILVKGLDHALLERRKAELSQGGKLGQVTDEDLETAYMQNVNQSASAHITALSSSTPSSKNVINKKHRDELLAQLKNSRHQHPQDLVVVEKLKAAGKFKPIGVTTPDPSTQDPQLKERKRQKAGKTKKKKARKSDHAATSPSSNLNMLIQTPKLSADSQLGVASAGEEVLKSDQREPGIAEIKEQSDVPSQGTPLAPSLPAAATNQPRETLEIEEAIEDEEFDIFGNAGEYKGLDEDSSEEEDRDRKFKRSESPPADVSGSLHPQATKKRKTYFENDEVESDADSEKAKMQEFLEESRKKPFESSRRTDMTVEQPGQETVDDDNNHDSNQIPRLMKLEGLSGSADIKSILAADAIQEKEEKRKAKKQKNKAEKILTDKDRLNRDYLEMERYLKQKKNPDQSLSISTPNTTEN